MKVRHPVSRWTESLRATIVTTVAGYVLFLSATLGPVVPATAQVPGHARATEARGDSLMQAFDTSGAIGAYRAGLSAHPDDVGLLVAAARALANLSEERPGEEGDEARYAEAVEMARKAIRLAPDEGRTHSALAAALGRYAVFQGGRRKVEMAREVYEEANRAIELDNSDYRPYIVLGAWNREVATLNPILRGIAGTFLGGLPDASLEQSAASLRRARRLEPNLIFTRVELARTLIEMDQEAAARRELEVALSLAPREQLDRVLQRRARKLVDEIS